MLESTFTWTTASTLHALLTVSSVSLAWSSKMVGHCSGWTTESRQEAIVYAPLAQAVKDYQDPAKADKITKIQRELDETTEILVRHQSGGVACLSIVVYVCFDSWCLSSLPTRESEKLDIYSCSITYMEVMCESMTTIDCHGLSYPDCSAPFLPNLSLAAPDDRRGVGAWREAG